MARVLVLTADLLFGSRVQGDLSAAGHEVELIGDETRLRARLAGADAGSTEGKTDTSATDVGVGDAALVDVLIVDLTDARLDGAGVVERLTGNGLPASAKTLGFYSHVDVAARERAERAGFDLMVPRSRMAREGATVVSGLAG